MTFRDIRISLIIFVAGVTTGIYLIFGLGATIGSRLELVGARLGAAAAPTYVDARFDDFTPPSHDLRAVYVDEPAPRGTTKKGRR